MSTSEIDKLQKTIATVEAQRAGLGDAAVDPVLEGLRRQLAVLEAAEQQRQRQYVEQTRGGERRIVTALVCDVRGSTAMAEKLDPEAWTEIMDEAFNLLIEPIDRFEGTVAQLLGDGILAFFGAPTAHEDDPQRALLAGLAIIENIQTMRAALRQSRGLDFNVRVGINTGLVVTGTIGSERYMEYQALGDGVNLASLMEKTAEPGTVHVSETTYKLAADSFHFAEGETIEVTGKQHKVRTYQVLGFKMGAEIERGLTTYGISSPLIGREREFSAAQSAINRLLQGKGGILLIIGEAGIGKSRLIAEIKQENQERSIDWFTGHTLFYGQSISYYPFQRILRQFAAINEDDEEQAWEKLEGKVQALYPEGKAEIVPYLAAIMALEPQGDYVERVKFLDGEALRDQILVASRRLFERLAQKRPLVLIFEDLQWVDPSSTRLLEHLLPLVEQTQLLIIGAGRPEPDGVASAIRQTALTRYAASTLEITLAPLNQAGSSRLISALLANDDLPQDVQELIVQKGGGNPFFVEEIIRDLIEERAVVQVGTPTQWQVTSRLDTIRIPDTIQGVITARIDRLERGVKRVLRAAAVIGQTFRLRLLAAVLDTEQFLDEQLAALQTAEIISMQQQQPELVFVFNNALAQEITYKSILLQTRRSLHALVGQAIESLFVEHLEEFYGLLAYHYAQAEAWEPAQKYLIKAGDQAGQVAGGMEALSQYRQAMEAYEKAFGDKWDPLQRAELVRKIGEATYGLGRLPESVRYFKTALTLLDRPLPDSRTGLFGGLAGQVVRQAAHRLWPARFLGRASAARIQAIREVVRSYERLGVIFYIQGEAASSVYAFLRSLNMAEPAGPSPELARAYANNVIAAGLIPPIRFMAERYSDLALETGLAGDDLAALAWVQQLVGINSTGLGRWPEAVAAEEEAAAINKRIGRLRWWEESTAILAQALHYQGNFARALELYRQVYNSSHERGDQQTQLWALAGQVETMLRVGNLDQLQEIMDKLEQAQVLLREYRYPNRPDEIQVFGLKAQAHLLGQEWKQAWETAEKVRELIEIEWPPSTFYTFEAYAGQSGVYLGLLDQQEAGQPVGLEREKLLKAAVRACHNMLNFARVFPFARPRSAFWQGNLDWRQNKGKKAFRSWHKSLDDAQRLHMPYDVGLAHLQIGRHLPVEDPLRQEHLEQAEKIFVAVGSAWDLVQVKEVTQERKN